MSKIPQLFHRIFAIVWNQLQSASLDKLIETFGPKFPHPDSEFSESRRRGRISVHLQAHFRARHCKWRKESTASSVPSSNDLTSSSDIAASVLILWHVLRSKYESILQLFRSRLFRHSKKLKFEVRGVAPASFLSKRQQYLPRLSSEALLLRQDGRPFLLYASRLRHLCWKQIRLLKARLTSSNAGLEKNNKFAAYIEKEEEASFHAEYWLFSVSPWR